MRMRSSPTPARPSGRPEAVTRMSVAHEAVPLCSAIAAATSLATMGSPSIATTTACGLEVDEHVTPSSSTPRLTRAG